MKRRTFIFTGVAIAAGIGLSDLFLLSNHSRWKKQPLLYPFILSNILDEESLRVIGNSYRVKRPDENSKEKLLNAITRGMPIIQNKTNDRANQAMEIEQHVEMEFKSDKLVVIKGWVISETEARQCALLSLS
ncbi:MAG TPA: hypothetical protein VK622_15645 [Puia sp.]|nr:hypothetical protein [Puia sp.]